MTTVVPKPVDLTVKFGDQKRAKCPTCRCFMKETDADATCGRCGRSFDRQPTGLFVPRQP